MLSNTRSSFLTTAAIIALIAISSSAGAGPTAQCVDGTAAGSTECGTDSETGSDATDATALGSEAWAGDAGTLAVGNRANADNDAATGDIGVIFNDPIPDMPDRAYGKNDI